jgi:hypothetical protein
MLLFTLFSVLAFGQNEFGKQKAANERLMRVNNVLLSALEEITQSDTKSDSGETPTVLEEAPTVLGQGKIDPDVDRSVLGPAGHCMELANIPVSFDEVNQKNPCLKDYCNKIETADECLLDENFKHGCSWCAGKCQPFGSYQKAFIDCVREAYKDHDPDKVNGVVPPGEPTNSAFNTEFFNHPIGKPGHSGLPYIGQMRWAFSTASRNVGERVPIHIHPFAGMSCINTHNGELGTTVTAEGEEDLLLPSGQCYTMPPFTKLGPWSMKGYSVRDTFVWDTCYPIWVVIEPKAYFVQDTEFNFESDLEC